MRGVLAVTALLGTSLTVLHAETESGGVGESERDKGFRPKSSGIQALSVSSFDTGDPTDEEQLTLELINRARANPGAEANRFGISLNQGLPAGTISNTPKPPLAMHEALRSSARLHSQWMLDTDIFSHTGAGNSSSKDRMEDGGYAFTGAWKSGENIAWQGTSGSVDLEEFAVKLYERLFKSSSHRTNLMDADFDEIGIGLLEGNFVDGGINWNAAMVTQDFARSASSPSPEGPLVLGVAYADTNGNAFYDPGEGLGGLTVTLSPGDTTTSTSASGGYAIPLGSTTGAITVTFSGNGLSAPREVATTASGVNVKADLVVTPPQPTVATPVINPNGGSFGGKVKVKLTTSTGGAVIRYTTNGAEPTSASKKYSRTFTLRATTTVKAKAFKSGMTDSATATATFTKN
jgi:hypothetical protein